MAPRSCSSSFTYDVFLSFRGEDTRHGFTGYLYRALDNKEIRTFKDDEEIQKGEEIRPALVKAIEGSRIAIVVLSKDYASSSFCLEELATILECLKGKDRRVLPVFYKVDPSDVRHQNGSYGEALATHEKRFKAEKERFNHNMEKLEKLEKWKMALRQVANLSGYHFNGFGYEYKFIEEIVEQVSRVINRIPLHVADYPVGLKSQVVEVRKLLDVGSDDGVHMIGIHGMGGIGKSTLARAVYNNLIAENFDGLCFLDNVREKSNKQGLEHLQSIILSEILEEKNINLTSVKQGSSVIQQRLQRKKVLLILDDVDKHEQLETIVGRPDWFGPGSRVIITTRDRQLLDYHEVKRTYKVKELNENDALQLLTWKAFKKEKVDPRYVKILNHVVTYASCLPLALEVIGSNLFEKNIEEWESAINQYKRIPHRRIQEVLKISYDALHKEEKSVFLDISCCFKGYALKEVEDILRARYGHNMKHHISVLVEKSLIKLSEGKVTLHDLIEDMGKEIVRQQSPDEPRKRSRLWSTEDIRKVLKDNTGTSRIEIICLDVPISDKEEEVEWNGNAFKKMKNLKILIIRNGKFSKGPNYFPATLRVLHWHRYPSNCLPSDFHPKKLDICKLPDSNFRSFEFHGLSKKLVNLTDLNFDKCKFLTHIPDVFDLQNLEKLSFKECENFITVHDSIGFLAKLKTLSAKGCKKLKSFPPLNLTSLERLELSYCSSLEKFPEISGKTKNIRVLRLEGLSRIELPSSFQNLIGLQKLYLICEIVQLPCSIAMMPELSLFYAQDCKGLQWVKSDEGEEKVGSIVSSKVDWFFAVYCNLNYDFFSLGFKRFAQVSRLWLATNNFTFLPECIKEFQLLRYLDVSDCKHLQEIRGVPPNLKYFWAKNCISLTSSSSSMFNQELHEAGKTYFCFPGASIPEWFNHQSRGPSTSFWFRNEFPAKVLCLLITPVVNNTFRLFYPTPMVFINGKVQESLFHHLNKKNVSMSQLDHTYLFDLQVLDFEDDLFEVPLVKEWNHVEVSYEGMLETSLIKATGIHVFKQDNGMDDIRFDDPYSKRKVADDLNSSESQPLVKKHRLA